MEERVRRIEVIEYGELLHLASSHHEAGCLSLLTHSLGPAGCGLVAVRGVPSLLSTRQALLPLARFLALLPPLQRFNILKGHGLGTDVSMKDSDRPVSSFAAQLSFRKDEEYVQASSKGGAVDAPQRMNTNSESSHFQVKNEHIEDGLQQLGSLFKELGKAMMEVGLLVARICDMAIPGVGLEEAILQACTAKGRLIHYHSLADRLFLETILSSTGSKACKQKKMHHTKEDPSASRNKNFPCKDSWQQWHFDYGIFTVLTVPMFLSLWDMDKSYLGAAFDHLLSPELRSSHFVNSTESADDLCRHIGLKVLNTGNGVVEFVSVPPDCLIVQVGEVAQILTGGKLQATAHCVCRPPGKSDLSRETFVVFLQPAWHKHLYWPNLSTNAGMHDGHLVRKDVECCTSDKDFQEIQSMVPALESRWKNGSTFAEFSKETTKQYYGANGAQSKK